MQLLEIIGILASIFGFILSLIDLCKNKNKGLALLILLMTIVLACTFYEYTILADERLHETERRETAAREATKLLETVPSIISDYEVGQNTAIVYQTLFYIEKYDDLFPETAKLYKENVIDKLSRAEEETYYFDERKQIKECAESARQILVSMSNK